MKKWLLFFALSIALVSAACANKGQTSFEDTGKNADQGIKADHDANRTGHRTQTTGEKVDQGLNDADRALQKTGNKIDEGLNKTGEEIKKGFNKAGEEVNEATH